MDQTTKRKYTFSDAGRLAHRVGCAKGGRNAVGVIKAHSSEQARAACNVRWARYRAEQASQPHNTAPDRDPRLTTLGKERWWVKELAILENRIAMSGGAGVAVDDLVGPLNWTLDHLQRVLGHSSLWKARHIITTREQPPQESTLCPALTPSAPPAA